MNIADIKKMDSGSVVGSLSGVVTKVGQERSGMSKFGKPWRLLPVYVKDSTGEIKLDIWNARQVPQVGTSFSITANKKNGVLGGVIFQADDGTDRQGNATTWLGVKVSESATLIYGSSGNALDGSPLAQGAASTHRGGTLGQTVGMALKLAGDLWLAQGEPFSGEATVAKIETIARQLISASSRLEKFDPNAAKPAAKPAPKAEEEDNIPEAWGKTEVENAGDLGSDERDPF